MIKVVITSIICGVFSWIIPPNDEWLAISPIIFALTIGSFNYNQFRKNPVFSILIFIFLSILFYYLSIFLAIGFMTYFPKILSFLEIPDLKFITELAIVLSGIISAIILYSIISTLLINQKVLIGITLIITCSLLPPIVVWFLSSDKNYLNEEDFQNYRIAWLIFFSLGYGLAINQREISNSLRVIIKKRFNYLN